jgi:isocitrate lyase
MRFGRGDRGPKKVEDFVAAEDADRLAQRAAAALERADGADWYEEHASAVDEAALALTRLRRASAGLHGGTRHGDAAVRRVLAKAPPEAVVWLASRSLSYMDETGFPEAVEAWFPDMREPR